MQDNKDLITGLDYSYLDQIVANIRSSMNVTRPMQPIKPGPLLSIHLQSNRPDNFTKFLEELEASVDDPSCIEVVVKIDDTDAAMNALLPRLVAKHDLTVKYISTPLVGGFFGLWSSMNDMLKACHPHAYFLWNMNDEMAVLNKGWDTVLKKYVGLFPDHIFRLRTSVFRFRNYYDIWECGFAPETSAITTKRWIDICGDWNPCLGPDSFNQCVAFYFGYHDRFSKGRAERDVPIHDILLAGEGAFVGLEGDKLWKRMCGATKAWARLMSYPIQLEASRRSQKLLAHIWAFDNRIKNFTVEDDHLRRKIFVYDGDRKSCQQFSYGLSPVGVWLKNLYRATYYYYYGGGGSASKDGRFRQIIALLALRYDHFEWLHTLNQFVEKKAYKKASRSPYAIAKKLYIFVWGAPRFYESIYSFDALEQKIDWNRIQPLLDKLAFSKHMTEGHTQVTLLRCLLLKRWYGLSSKELEEALERYQAFRRFVRISQIFDIPPATQIESFQGELRDAGLEEQIYSNANVLFEQGAELPMRTLVGKAA